MSDFIPVNIPLLSGNEKKYLNECIDTGWISSEGPFVERFESAFGASLGGGSAVAVANGSAALDVAIAALRIKPGDEVILPTFTIISCAQSIVRAGGVPVVVDSDPLTWNMDVSQIEGRISSRTVAIMAVHLYGLPVDMDPIIEIARKYGLTIIEDAAEAIGVTYKGRPCGSLGDISAFSFYPNKHIATGEGGMVFTKDKVLAERCRSLRNLCFQPHKRFIHEELGWNYRMTNMQAALGLAQLEKLDEHLAIKRKTGRLYQELFSDLSGVQLPLEHREYAENYYWVFGLVLNGSECDGVELIMNKLAAEGVGSRPFFWCMHEQPVFQRMGLFSSDLFPVAEKLARNGFYIPSGLGLSNEQIHIVAEKTKKVIREIL